MAQILVRNLAPETVARLKAQAAVNNRSLEAEVRMLLEEVAAREEKRRAFLQFAREMQEASGPQTSDSADLIREDRER